jgi:hypothetical protein
MSPYALGEPDEPPAALTTSMGSTSTASPRPTVGRVAPMVFLAHGLMLGMWMMSASLGAYGSGPRVR